MKIPTILLTLLFVGSAFCDDPESLTNDALVKAVTSSNWSWETNSSGTKTFSDIQFYQGGLARNSKFFTSGWKATGPRTLRLENTKEGGSNEGKVAYLVFDADFTRFVGIHFDGKSIVEGSRRESIDPARTPPAAETK
jgi:hypothetical protein